MKSLTVALYSVGLATLALALIAAYQVLGAWYLVLGIATYVAMAYALHKLSFYVQRVGSTTSARVVLVAWFALLLAANVAAFWLVWTGFGIATALALYIAYYALMALSFYAEFKAKPRGATTTWI